VICKLSKKLLRAGAPRHKIWWSLLQTSTSPIISNVHA